MMFTRKKRELDQRKMKTSTIIKTTTTLILLSLRSALLTGPLKLMQPLHHSYKRGQKPNDDAA